MDYGSSDPVHSTVSMGVERYQVVPSAYVHLPVDTHDGKLQPKSQLMIYLGTAPRNKHNYLFMRPDNSLHTYAHAIFNENLFPHCQGAWPHKPVSDPPGHPHQHPPKPSPLSDDECDDLPEPSCHKHAPTRTE